ncbi:hypothetical protein F5148DRAFT_1183925 [Russula earlei]|uniref:Uncharacterized protein n=1 Tax=Russula earlei TaxID=71964 RepID=A0ACC0UFQ4_9AGAM|nr:hypothetical protein F5148DRAFT_1183925 [Russula earlei]
MYNSNNLSRRPVLSQALCRYSNCQPPSTKTKVLLFAWFNHHPSAPLLSDISSSAPERGSSKSSSPSCLVEVHAPDAFPAEDVIFVLFGMPANEDSSGNLRINKRPETSANHARTEELGSARRAPFAIKCIYTPISIFPSHHSAPFYQIWHYLSSSSRTRPECSGDHPRQCCCLARL